MITIFLSFFWGLLIPIFSGWVYESSLTVNGKGYSRDTNNTNLICMSLSYVLAETLNHATCVSKAKFSNLQSISISNELKPSFPTSSFQEKVLVPPLSLVWIL